MINKIYLAGGMANLSFKEQNRWREKIINRLRPNYPQLEVINPTDYFNFQSIKYKSQREVKNFDIREVKTSDLVIVYFNDPKSIGTAQELQCANDYDIPVIGIWESEENKQRKILGKPPKKLHPWLEESCERIFEDLDECIDYVIEFYLEKRSIE